MPLFTYDEDVPDHLKCPLSRDLFEVPLQINGIHFEESYFLTWKKNNSTCPVTRKSINGGFTFPQDKKDEADKWFEEHKVLSDEPTIKDMDSLSRREVDVALELQIDPIEILAKCPFPKFEMVFFESLDRIEEIEDFQIRKQKLFHFGHNILNGTWAETDQAFPCCIFEAVSIPNEFKNIQEIFSYTNSDSIDNWKSLVSFVFDENTSRLPKIINNMIEKAIHTIPTNTTPFASEKEICVNFITSITCGFDDNTALKQIGNSILDSYIANETITQNGKTIQSVGEIIIQNISAHLYINQAPKPLSLMKRMIKQGEMVLITVLLDDYVPNIDKNTQKFIKKQFSKALRITSGAILDYCDKLYQIPGMQYEFQKHAVEIAMFLFNNTFYNTSCPTQGQKLLKEALPFIENGMKHI